MSKSYDIEMVPLYKHQEKAIERLTKGNHALWHEMGLGKTRSALLAFRYLEQTTQADLLIIVCPKIAKYVWAKEAKTCGMTTPLVLSGKTKTVNAANLSLFDEEPTIVILNYDILSSWLPYLQSLPGEKVIVFDEAHYLRNNRTKRYKAVQQIVPFAKFVWELTGTPMANSALDLHWQLRLLGQNYPHFAIKNKETFGKRYCNPKYNAFTGFYDWVGIVNEEKLMERIDHLVDRKLKADCLDLPEKLRNAQWLERQERMGVDFGGNIAASLGEARHALSDKKAKLTIDYLEQSLEERPVVVIGYHHTYLNKVAAHFHAPVIDGSTSDNLRRQYMEDFEAGGVPILIGQMQAMGQAITLVRGCHMVFGELHWSALDHRQAEDRLHRPGQTRDVTYHYLLIENSVEELVWKHVLAKGNAIDKLDTAATSLNDLVPLFTG